MSSKPIPIRNNNTGGGGGSNYNSYHSPRSPHTGTPGSRTNNPAVVFGSMGSPLIGSYRRAAAYRGDVLESPMIGNRQRGRRSSESDSDDDDDSVVARERSILTPPAPSSRKQPKSPPSAKEMLSPEETLLPPPQSSSSPSSASAKLRHGSVGLEGYLWGQIGNVIKMAVWWTVFGALVFALFDGNSVAIGAMRVSFNMAMLLFSPIAGAIADKASVRNVLMNTTIVRGAVYVVLLPGAWILMESEWFGYTTRGLGPWFLALFLVLVFVDGVAVAFANIVDIDAGGTDLVAAQCHAEVDDTVRNRFNSLHEAFFNGAMIFFSPLIAFLSYAATEHWHHKDRVSMLAALSGLFLFTTMYSLYHYGRSLPKIESTGRVLPTSEEMSEIVGSILEGFRIAWRVKAIRWRLVFLALETSLEDAFVSLLVVEFALDDYYNNTRYATGNLLANGIVAVGKVGGVVAAILMHKYWTPPEDNSPASTRRAFRPMFYLVFGGALATLLVPLGSYVNSHHQNSSLGLFLVFLGSFLFFLCSTGPKIGFATLLQGLVVETGAPGRVFGFVASFITFVDSAVLMSMSVIFAVMHVQTALWITCGIIALHGVVELTLGPWLVLGAAHQDAEEVQRLNDGVVQANYTSLNNSDDNDVGGRV